MQLNIRYVDPKTRYFNIAYVYVAYTGENRFGNLTVRSENYPSRVLLIELLYSSLQKEIGPKLATDTIVIINIQEMSYEEHKSFTQGSKLKAV